MTKRKKIFYQILLLLTFLFFSTAALADSEVTILVDGIPLDAKGIVVDQDVFIPAWILENYGTTKVIWKPGDSILEINTAPPIKPIEKMEGEVTIRVGFYASQEGFIIGDRTNVYIFNINPETLRFKDGKSIHERAHEAAIARLSPLNDIVIRYLDLSPPNRYLKDGWRVISLMDRKEILNLKTIVDRYELLYKEMYYDILSTLVLEKYSMINDASSIYPELKHITSLKMITDEDGKGKVTLKNGTYFIYSRMFYKGSIIVWNLPVTISGNDISIELTNRDATYMK